MRPASASKKPATRNQRGRRPKGCSKARQPMALTSCCRTRGRATGRTRPQASTVLLKYGTTPYAGAAVMPRAGGCFCHIFSQSLHLQAACIFSLDRQLSQFAPKPCIFSQTTPVRLSGTDAFRLTFRYKLSAICPTQACSTTPPRSSLQLTTPV